MTETVMPRKNMTGTVMPRKNMTETVMPQVIPVDMPSPTPPANHSFPPRRPAPPG